MRSLLDVNVLIGLLDAGHVNHLRAREWFKSHAEEGWASCPITQNGCVRIISMPSYANSMSIAAVVDRLRAACSGSLHEFWPDDASILDPRAIDPSRMHGSRQLTDVYLLALAVSRRGRLVTFDGGISRAAVAGATPEHLIVI